VLRVAWLVLAAGGVLFAGESSPKATFQAMLDAAKAGNRDALLSCFDGEGRNTFVAFDALVAKAAAKVPALAGKSVVEELIKEAKKSTAVEYGDEKIEGDKATLVVTSGGSKDTIKFIREADGWKIQVEPGDIQKLKEQMPKLEEVLKGGGATPPKPPAAGDFSSPKAAWQSAWNAAKTGEPEPLLACFTKATAAKIRAVEKLMKDNADAMPAEMKGKSLLGEMTAKVKDPKTTMSVGEEKIDGEKAVLKVKMAGDEEDINFVKEDGAWKIELPAADLDELKKNVEDAVKEKK
jgi:hypothetical protein